MSTGGVSQISHTRKALEAARREAFQCGKTAYHDGTDEKTGNPYSVHSPTAAFWRDGWNEAREQAERETESYDDAYAMAMVMDGTPGFQN